LEKKNKVRIPRSEDESILGGGEGERIFKKTVTGDDPGAQNRKGGKGRSRGGGLDQKVGMWRCCTDKKNLESLKKKEKAPVGKKGRGKIASKRSRPRKSSQKKKGVAANEGILTKKTPNRKRGRR